MSTNINTSEAVQLTKAQLNKQRKLMKSAPARKFLKKRQMERGGVGDGYYRIQGRTADGKKSGELTKADGKIRTVYDMVDYYYGFVPEYMAKSSGDRKMSKQDNPMLTTSEGVRNAVYGSEVFSLVNHEPNIFALLENRAWVRSGERIATDHGHDLGSGGSAENAELDDTDRPPLDQFEVDPQTVQHNFDVSQVKELLAETEDDDLEDPFDWLRRWYGTGTEHQTGMGQHPKHINVQLGQNAPDREAEDLISLDQVIANGEEANAVEDAGLGDAEDYNVYGFDRAGEEEFEANVLHNEGSNRTFVIDLLDDAIREVKQNSGKNPVTDENYFFLTGHDTYQRIENEVGGKERLEAERVSVGMNGVDTQPGDDVGITVQSYKQIPIFESVDVPDDGISRVYLVDSSTMYFKTLLPTQFYSTGTEVDGNPFAIDRLGNQGLYVTIGQLSLTNPAAHVKVRDLT